MPTPLTEIPGIGPSTAEVLQANGFDSAETLAASTVEKISEVPGFGTSRATTVLEAARQIAVPDKSKTERPANKKVKQKAKDKKNKKDKKEKTKKGQKDKKKDKKKKGKKKKKK